MIYVYECSKIECKFKFEHKQKLNDNKPNCPVCNSEVNKKPAVSNFVLKGKGWYKDGYHKGK